MRVVSFFAGIGSFDIAAKRAGMEVVAQIEFEGNRRAVLAKHFPDSDRSVTDVRHANKENIPDAHVFTAGFPCQDVSIAGRRAGLAGERSGMFYEFHRVLTETYPEWVVLENVLGLLSSNGGRDFAIVLGGLTGIIPEVPDGGWNNAGLARGYYYNVAWRVLDAQYFGVPQRRRRIFLVASLGDGRAAQVLFEPESVPGTSATRPGTWKTTPRVTGTLSKSASGTARTGNEADMLVYGQGRAATYDARNHRINPGISGTLQAKKSGGQSLNYTNPVIVKTDNTGSNGWGVLEDGTTHSLGGTTDAVMTKIFQQNQRNDIRYINGNGERAGALSANAGVKQQNYVMALNPQASITAHSPVRKNGIAGTLGTTRIEGVMHNHIIRRLTPVECERLMGFPDGWTEGHSDSQRYSMLGDSIAVPCSEWIMKRIEAVA